MKNKNLLLVLCCMLIFTSVVFSQSQQGTISEINRQISDTSAAIDRTLTRRNNNSKKSSGRAAKTQKKLPTKSGNQQSAASKPKTYFSYIVVWAHGVASPAEGNLFINLTFTNAKTGQIIRRKYEYDKTQDGFGINDVPPGKYKLSADAIYKGKVVKALVGSKNVWTREYKVPYSDSMDVELITFIEGETECIKSEPGDLTVKIVE